jgi:hypothetical protein
MAGGAGDLVFTVSAFAPLLNDHGRLFFVAGEAVFYLCRSCIRAAQNNTGAERNNKFFHAGPLSFGWFLLPGLPRHLFEQYRLPRRLSIHKSFLAKRQRWHIIQQFYLLKTIDYRGNEDNGRKQKARAYGAGRRLGEPARRP